MLHLHSCIRRKNFIDVRKLMSQRNERKRGKKRRQLPLAAENPRLLEPLICNSSPVCGFLPTLGALTFLLKVPISLNRTSWPFSKTSLASTSRIASITEEQSFLETSHFDVRRSTNSALPSASTFCLVAWSSKLKLMGLGIRTIQFLDNGEKNNKNSKKKWILLKIVNMKRYKDTSER